MLIPLICSWGVLTFDGLPRFFWFESPLIGATSFVSLTTTTFFNVAVGSATFAGRPRARFGVAELTVFTFVEPADFGGRPRPFFPPAFTVDDDFFSFSSKSNFNLLSQRKQKQNNYLPWTPLTVTPVSIGRTPAISFKAAVLCCCCSIVSFIVYKNLRQTKRTRISRWDWPMSV